MHLGQRKREDKGYDSLATAGSERQSVQAGFCQISRRVSPQNLVPCKDWLRANRTNHPFFVEVSTSHYECCWPAYKAPLRLTMHVSKSKSHVCMNCPKAELTAYRVV